MGAYDSIFAGIANAKPIGGYSPRLGIGKHRVAIKRYKVKPSQQKNKGPFIESDFVVLTSNTHQVGETRGWAWFISSQGFAGAYEEARAKDFIAVVGRCIGDTREVSLIGADLAGEGQPGTGMMIDVEITPQCNRDGSHRMNPKGEVYTNAVWSPVTQDGAMIAKTRQAIDSLDAAPQQPAPAPVPAQSPFMQQAQPAQEQVASTPLTAFLTGLKR